MHRSYAGTETHFAAMNKLFAADVFPFVTYKMHQSTGMHVGHMRVLMTRVSAVQPSLIKLPWTACSNMHTARYKLSQTHLVMAPS